MNVEVEISDSKYKNEMTCYKSIQKKMKMKLLEFDNQWIPASDVLMNLSTECQIPDKRKLSES